MFFRSLNRIIAHEIAKFTLKWSLTDNWWLVVDKKIKKMYKSGQKWLQFPKSCDII